MNFVANILKRVFVISLIICISLTTAGCNSRKNISENQNKKNESITIQELNIEPKDIQNPIGINGDYFYYKIECGSIGENCDYAFWKYNLNTNEKTEMGIIRNFHTASAKSAFVGCEKLFMTYGINDENEGSYNAHLMLDLNNNKLTVLSKDNNFPPLIDTIPINKTYYLERHPKRLQNGGYQYDINVGDTNGHIINIISKQRSETLLGETISSVSVYNDKIYTFEYVETERYICSYDLNGNQITRETNDIVNEFLDTPDKYTNEPETLWSMNVVNGYYFFDTMNGKRLVLHNQNGKYSKVNELSDNDICIVTNHNPLTDKIIMFNYNTKELLCFDTNKGKLINLGITLENASYLTTDGQKLVFSSDNKLYVIKNVFQILPNDN